MRNGSPLHQVLLMNTLLYSGQMMTRRALEQIDDNTFATFYFSLKYIFSSFYCACVTLRVFAWPLSATVAKFE